MRALRLYMISLVVFGLIVAGCATDNAKSFKSGSYKALSIAGSAYDTGMASMGNLYRNGLIDEETKAEVIKIGNIYYDSYHSAVEALKAFAAAGDDAQYEDAQAKIMAAGVALGKFLAYINPILLKYGLEEVR